MENKAKYQDFSLLNSNFEEILDIMSKDIKNKKQMVERRKQIKELLKDEFTPKQLENLFESYKKMIDYGLPDDAEEKIAFTKLLDNSSIEIINSNINKFSRYVLEVGNNFTDHGYSLLLGYYFYITKQ